MNSRALQSLISDEKKMNFVLEAAKTGNPQAQSILSLIIQAIINELQQPNSGQE